MAKEEYALLCRVPLDLDQKTLETVMKSKSKKIEYRVRDVVGKPSAIFFQQDLLSAARRRQNKVYIWVSTYSYSILFGLVNIYSLKIMPIKSYIHYIATNIIEYKSEFQFKKVSHDATFGQ